MVVIQRVSPSANRSKLFDDFQNVLRVTRPWLKVHLSVYVTSQATHAALWWTNRHLLSSVSILVDDRRFRSRLLIHSVPSRPVLTVPKSYVRRRTLRLFISITLPVARTTKNRFMFYVKTSILDLQIVWKSPSSVWTIFFYPDRRFKNRSFFDIRYWPSD